MCCTLMPSDRDKGVFANTVLAIFLVQKIAIPTKELRRIPDVEKDVTQVGFDDKFKYITLEIVT